jgi:hypothetical protein
VRRTIGKPQRVTFELVVTNGHIEHRHCSPKGFFIDQFAPV